MPAVIAALTLETNRALTTTTPMTSQNGDVVRTYSSGLMT